MLNNNISGGATADMAATRNTCAKIEKIQGYDEDISSHEIPQRSKKGGRSQLPNLVNS